MKTGLQIFNRARLGDGIVYLKMYVTMWSGGDYISNVCLEQKWAKDRALWNTY